MKRSINERGESFELFLDPRDRHRNLILTLDECRTVDFATLPPGTDVVIHDYPVRASYVYFTTSGSKLRVTLAVVLADRDPAMSARLAIMRTGLVRAARLLQSEGRNYRGYSRWAEIRMWTLRFQRGDAVLRLIRAEFDVIFRRAEQLLHEVVNELRF
jgi:hypothetical protein